MDSFHLVLYRRETRLACRGYEELTVKLTIYQRKHWRFDCCRGCLGWPRVPKRAVQTFPTWTRRVFIACYSMIVLWICCSFGSWRWGLTKPQCMMGGEVTGQALRLVTMHKDAPVRPCSILISSITPWFLFVTLQNPGSGKREEYFGRVSPRLKAHHWNFAILFARKVSVPF